MKYPNSVMISTFTPQVEAQDNEKKDSIPAAKTAMNKTEGDRNVMLNAANNTGPRDVNTGLPATVVGITIQENNLPVVYFYWPELPNRTWRQCVRLGATIL
ncbi:hypothetical protein [[Flexibacter] sp. ATCC 35208]|uniref:hypothetical protein n=1 Tax=[Flexibacter] sp. ATCC 35208 TaxID=1936242 RepID=UPI0009D2ED46|nr:hypothetical protein [[Flexibacter] sp. ATCC 35208]OMP79120.1 hypothetical protein BW716_10895 [[Flexibacter] sp. ATCC 35208]